MRALGLIIVLFFYALLKKLFRLGRTLDQNGPKHYEDDGGKGVNERVRIKRAGEERNQEIHERLEDHDKHKDAKREDDERPLASESPLGFSGDPPLLVFGQGIIAFLAEKTPFIRSICAEVARRLTTIAADV